MKKRLIFLFIAVISLNFSSTAYSQTKDERQFTIYLAGDSTVKTYEDTVSYGGWGGFIRYFFDSSVFISNYAIGGRSSRQFINEGTLDTILNQIKPGDYLFIQFGHNDAANINELDAYGRKIARLERSVALGAPVNGVYPTTPIEKVPMDLINLEEFNMQNNAYIELLQSRSTYRYGEYYYPYELHDGDKVVRGTYKWYLSQYIESALEKGATPVILTPLVRRFFKDEKIQPHHYDLQNKGIIFPYKNDGYVEAAIEIAKEYDVPCIDLYKASKEYYERLGSKETAFLNINKTDGTVDASHQNKYGAYEIAEIISMEIKKSGMQLSDYLIEPSTEPPARQLLVEQAEPSRIIKNSKTWIFGEGYFSNHFEKRLVDLIGEQTTIDKLKFVTNVHKKISFNNKKTLETENDFFKGCVTIHHSDFDAARIEIPVEGNCKIKVTASGKTGEELIIGSGLSAKYCASIKFAEDNKSMLLEYDYTGGGTTLSLYKKGKKPVDIYLIELLY